MRARDEKGKLAFLLSILVVWIAVIAAFAWFVHAGVIHKVPYLEELPDNSTDSDVPHARTPTKESLLAATAFVDKHLIRPNGHINLYLPLRGQEITWANHTNSEAISYRMLIAAQDGDKKMLDLQLTFFEMHMMHPTGYMMWRLDDNDIAEGEGRNIAPDADLRALHALYIAKDRWGGPRYDRAIENLAKGLETTVVADGLLVGYGGADGTVWRAHEAWLSYMDFQVLDRLANTRSGIWADVNKRMKNISLDAQLWNGLYNSVYFEDGRYGNHLDNGAYSINSMWVMVRFAESGDPVLMESARKGLRFYQDKFAADNKIIASYDSSSNPIDTYESPWAYALVARTAYALDEDTFGQIVEQRMLDYQDVDEKSDTYGAIIEGKAGDERIGQFTMQEVILTLQESQGKAVRFNE